MQISVMWSILILRNIRWFDANESWWSEWNPILFFIWTLSTKHASASTVQPFRARKHRFWLVSVHSRSNENSINELKKCKKVKKTYFFSFTFFLVARRLLCIVVASNQYWMVAQIVFPLPGVDMMSKPSHQRRDRRKENGKSYRQPAFILICHTIEYETNEAKNKFGFYFSLSELNGKRTFYILRPSRVRGFFYCRTYFQPESTERMCRSWAKITHTEHLEFHVLCVAAACIGVFACLCVRQ